MKQSLLTKKKNIKITKRPKLIVFRSLKHLYGQIVDSQSCKTIVSVSDLTFDKIQNDNGINRAKKAALLGQELAKKALRSKIKKVVFDRRGYKYHGNIKIFADSARKAGLEF